MNNKKYKFTLSDINTAYVFAWINVSGVKGIPKEIPLKHYSEFKRLLEGKK